MYYGCDTGVNAQDVQHVGKTVHVLLWPHNVTMNTHVTRCTYASTIAANLVEGTSECSAAQTATSVCGGANLL